MGNLKCTEKESQVKLQTKKNEKQKQIKHGTRQYLDDSQFQLPEKFNQEITFDIHQLFSDVSIETIEYVKKNFYIQQLVDQVQIFYPYAKVYYFDKNFQLKEINENDKNQLVEKLLHYPYNDISNPKLFIFNSIEEPTFLIQNLKKENVDILSIYDFQNEFMITNRINYFFENNKNCKYLYFVVENESQLQQKYLFSPDDAQKIIDNIDQYSKSNKGFTINKFSLQYTINDTNSYFIWIEIIKT